MVDESELLGSGAVLEVLLAGDGVAHVLEALDVNEAMDAVACGEGVVFAGAVLG